MAIREAQEEDLPRLLNIYNHYVEHTSITFDIDRVSLAARKLWFEGFDPSGPHRLYVAESESRVHGYASSRVSAANAPRAPQRSCSNAGCAATDMAGRRGQPSPMRSGKRSNPNS